MRWVKLVYACGDEIERLREENARLVDVLDGELMKEAADEIERLRAERDELRAELTAAQTVASEHETDAIEVDEERFVAWAERDRAVAERDALREENARLNSELSEERERVTVLEDELFLLEQKDCNEENYLQSQLDAVVIERNTLREENARLREALKVAAGFLGDAYKDIGRDEYKVAEFVARSAAAAIRETGDE